jgi:hypothetical protein
MITEEEAIAIKCAVRRLVRAEIDESWKGTENPIYHKDIATELRSARSSLASLLSPKTQKKDAQE